MRLFLKAIAAGIFSVGALGFAAAQAGDRHHRPAHCDHDHDHRSHHANYYDYFAADRYYRAGPYQRSGASFSITVGDSYRYRDGRRYDRDYYGRRNGYRGPRARIVNREVFDTRYRARIVLTEEVVRTRRGPRLVCNVRVRGPEARYVSERRLRRLANRNCSRNARVNIY